MEREAVLVGIDVGTSKVCALIGEVSRDGKLTIMGHGTVPASGLNAEQSALLAGSLINPRRYSPGAPPRRLLARQRIILRRMRIGGGPLAATAPPRISAAPRPAEQENEVPAELETLEEDPEAPEETTEETAPPDSTVPPTPPAQDPP